MAAQPSMSDLWLRNLRMLNLDRLPDWPSKLSANTFREDDIRTRKARVRRAEWILFRLYELWDPREAQASLNSLFPALEPAQSTRLRSTILALLSNLKQEGHLGTCSLRKSLLDECSGPRFEHLLLALSTAVLKRVVLTDSGPLSLALGQATSANAGDADADHLALLALVHQVPLASSLQAKQLMRVRTEGLEAYIHIKELTVQAQDDFAKASLDEVESEFAKADVDAKALKKQVRLAAGADEAWANLLLSGEPSRDRDPMIEDTFPSLWTRTQRGDDFQQHPGVEPGFLSNLETRLGEQQERLRKWRSFQSQISQRNGDMIISRTPLESPRKTPSVSVRRSPTKSRRKASTSNETPSPKKKPVKVGESYVLQSVHEPPAAVESASNRLLSAMMDRDRDMPSQSPVISSPLTRSTSLRQTQPARRTAANDEQKRDALSNDSNLRRRSRSELSKHTPQSIGAEEQAATPVNELTKGLGRLRVEDKRQTLAERTMVSMASASQHQPPKTQGRRRGSHAHSVSQYDLEHALETSDSPLAAKSGQNLHVSLVERAQKSLQGLEGQGLEGATPVVTRRPRPRPSERSPTKSYAAISTDQVGEAAVGAKEEDHLPQTPAAEGLVLEADDAESIFKTRTRLRRSPPPG